jgi:multidrug efflux pump subunit AcrA (membrane-fusion protein)
MGLLLDKRPQPALLMVLFLVFALVFSGCGRSETNAKAKGNSAGNSNSETFSPGAPVPVTVATAVTKEVPSFIQATGSFAANETSDVASQTSGQVVSTPVSIGAFVKQGSVIARLNERDARLRLQQAQAGLQQANAAVRQAEVRLGLGPNARFDASAIPEVRSAGAAYEAAASQARLAEANARRYSQLVETGDVARSVYDQYRTQAESAIAQANNARQQLEAAINVARQSNQAIQTAQAAAAGAQAQVEIAQKGVTDTTVRAPYTGYISNRPTAVGEYVTPASIIATILLTNPIKLDLQIPESESPKVKPGMPVSVTVDAFGDRKFGGQIVAINPAIDPASRSVMVEAKIENGDNALRSGMFATARLTQPGGGQAIFVPTAAVVSDRNTNSYRVFVIQGDTARLRVVQIGDNENGMTQILNGVQANEVVATSGMDRLYEGAKVKAG